MGDRWGAAFVRIGWQASFGLGGSFPPDWVPGTPVIRNPPALFVLVWLSFMLPLPGSKRAVSTPPVPVKPKRQRSTEPKPFAGLTHKPSCVLCERDAVHAQPPPPVPPAP